MVELRVELGWNYMKFHPNSTHNSTSPNTLNIKHIYCPGWKGGIINDKKYFLRIIAEKLRINVKNKSFQYHDLLQEASF